MKISVACCTYNGERFIEEQIRSIVNQTQKPDEIVCCDDGSKDGTIGKLLKLKECTSIPLRIIRNKENLGFVRNFEKAISLCSGDIVFCSDQDDIWMPEKVEMLMTRFDENPDVVLAFHDVTVTDERLNVEKQTLWHDIVQPDVFEGGDYRRLIPNNIIQGSACAFRREFFEMVKPIPDGAFHDEYMGLMAWLYGKIAFFDKPLILYRQWGNNTFGTGELSILEKVQNYIVHTRKKMRNYYEEEVRRAQVLQSVLKRANNMAKQDVVNIMAMSEDLLKHRLSFISGNGNQPGMWHYEAIYGKQIGRKTYIRDKICHLVM